MTREEAVKTVKKLKLNDLMVAALEDIVADAGTEYQHVHKRTGWALARRGLAKVDLQSGRATALTDAGRSLAIGLGVDVKSWEESRARAKKAEAAARKKAAAWAAAPVKTRYSGAMRDLLLRLLHHGNANLSQNDRTAKALIERGEVFTYPRTPAPVRWMSWGSYPREGEPKFLHGRGRLMLTATGRDDAKAMEADGVKRDALSEEGLRDLLTEAIGFAGGEDLFKRMGYRVGVQPFHVNGPELTRPGHKMPTETWGFMVAVDGVEFRVDVRKVGQ